MSQGAVSSPLRSRSRALSFKRTSGLYVGALIVLYFSVTQSDTFPTVSTLKDLAAGDAVTAIVALGLLFPLIAGEFDLSIGFALGTSAIMSSSLMVNHGIAPFPAMAICLAGAALFGLLNAWLVATVGMDSFIATLGTGSVLQAIIVGTSDSQTIIGLPESFTRLGTTQIAGVPIAFVYLVVLAVLVWYVLERTSFGRRLYALGFGREAAKLSGVPSGVYLSLCFVASSVLAAVGGLIVTAQVGAGSPGVGDGYLLPVFAALFLGTTQIKPGRANVWGTVLAVYIIAVGIKGLTLSGAQAWVTYLFNGVALLLAVGLSRVTYRRPRWTRRARTGGLRPQEQDQLPEKVTS